MEKQAPEVEVKKSCPARGKRYSPREKKAILQYAKEYSVDAANRWLVFPSNNIQDPNGVPVHRTVVLNQLITPARIQ